MLALLILPTSSTENLLYFEFIDHPSFFCKIFFQLLLKKFSFEFIYFLFMCGSTFAILHVCASYAHPVLAEARKCCQIFWKWNYMQLWVTLWLWGTEPGSFGRAASAPKHWVSYLYSLFDLQILYWTRIRMLCPSLHASKFLLWIVSCYLKLVNS